MIELLVVHTNITNESNNQTKVVPADDICTSSSSSSSYSSSNSDGSSTSSTTRNKIGTIWFDQLECMGDGDMFGSAFYVGSGRKRTYRNTIKEGTWMETYYQSNVSMDNTTTSLLDGIMAVNYTNEQAETWGGFVDHAHLAPGNLYYNLSVVTHLTLNYTIVEPASIPDVSIF
jgi:hypothetical protein